jgi:hypothetical protein
MILGYLSSSVYAFNLLCKRQPNYRLETVVIDSKNLFILTKKKYKRNFDFFELVLSFNIVVKA